MGAWLGDLEAAVVLAPSAPSAWLAIPPLAAHTHIFH